MQNITVDTETLSRLGGLQSPAKLVDDAGRVLGFLTPAEDPSVYAELDPGITEQELDSRANSIDGRTLGEILDDLSKES